MEEKPPLTEGNEKITKKLIQIFEKESDSAKKTVKEDAKESKTEAAGVVSQPGPSSRSSSPEPNCAICLESLQNKSFTDSCFHTFCFTCLVEWSKVKPECPLCKQKFKSIVHNVQKDLTFEEYHIVSRTASNSIPSIPEVLVERFRYRTTQVMARQVRAHRMQFAPHTVIALPPLPRGSSGLEFRRRVYAEGLWVKRSTLRQVRAASPEFFRRNPACTHRLLPWLQREMEALLGPLFRTKSRHLLNTILLELPRTDLHSPHFSYFVRPYLGAQTTHFLYEFRNFAASPLSMEAYDQSTEYSFLPSTHPAQPLIIPTTEEVPRNPTEEALDMSFRPPRARKATRTLPESVPGPSGVAGVSTSEDDDCQVVGVIKPRSERTPEIVQLSSDDEFALIDISSDGEGRTIHVDSTSWESTLSPTYSPTSPIWSSATYTPVSPSYSPISPSRSPASSYFSPVSPHCSPAYSTNFPRYPLTSSIYSSLLHPNSSSSSCFFTSTAAPTITSTTHSAVSSRFQQPSPIFSPFYGQSSSSTLFRSETLPASNTTSRFNPASSPCERTSPQVLSDSDVECIYQGKREPESPPLLLNCKPSTSSATGRQCSANLTVASASSSEPRGEKRPKLASTIIVPKKKSKTSSRHSYRFSDSDDSEDHSSGKLPKKVKKLRLSSVGVVPSHHGETSRDSSSRHSSYKLTVAFKKHKKRKHKEKKKHKRARRSESESN